MKKATIAAVAAAAMFGFGAVGTAMADVEISGFADINYHAFASEGTEGNFTASGEVDVIQTGDGATFRADFDLVNAHNGSAPGDLPSGTGGLGVDVEQLNFAVPLVPDMLTITAGIWNSPFGMEGQDAPDIHFAANGLLWHEVPSNFAGALASVTLNDMISANIGFANGSVSPDIAVGAENDVVITATVNPMEGISLTLGYLTDNGQNDTTALTVGDMFNVNAQIALVENLEVGLEYLSADPISNSGGFDDGFGIDASYHMGAIGVAVRYEATSAEGAGTDHDETSLALNYGMSDDCTVRVDYTNKNSETNLGVTNGYDTVTVQLLHAF